MMNGNQEVFISTKTYKKSENAVKSPGFMPSFKFSKAIQ